jgi:hypothetical protein
VGLSTEWVRRSLLSDLCLPAIALKIVFLPSFPHLSFLTCFLPSWSSGWQWLWICVKTKIGQMYLYLSWIATVSVKGMSSSLCAIHHLLGSMATTLSQTPVVYLQIPSSSNKSWVQPGAYALFLRVLLVLLSIFCRTEICNSYLDMILAKTSGVLSLGGSGRL